MKKIVKKALSTALALVMCAGLAAPAFAAVDLEQYINDAVKNNEIVQGIATNVKYIDVKAVENQDGTKDSNFVMSNDVTTEYTLRVANGERITLDMNGKTLARDNEKTSGAVIMATGDGSSLVIQNGGTITGGNNDLHNAGNMGGGVSVTDGAAFTMTGGQISGNKTDGPGGGIYADRGTVILNNVMISNNEAGNGGGIHAGGISNVTLNNVTIENNSATGSAGGINVIGLISYNDKDEPVNLGKSVLVMNGGAVSRNQASLSAGGISATQTDVKLDKVSITGNEASSSAGMYIVDSDDVTLKNVTVSKNHANVLFGGGIGLLNSSIKLEGTTVTGNTAKGPGGGLFLSTAANGTNSVEMTNGSIVDGNTGWKNTLWEQDNDVLILASDGTSTISGDTTVQKDGQAFVGWRSATPGLSDQAPEYTPDGKDQWVYLSSKWHSHTPGEAVRENEVDATCAKEGSYDEVVYCKDCHKVLSRETKTIEKLAHTPGEAVRENEVPAQVGVAGSYDEVVYCSECNEELSREARTIDALPTPPVAVVPGDDVVVDEDPGAEIDDPAVPLASGPVTRAQFIDYLWRHEGEPASDGVCTFADVPEDHEYVLALAWAEQNKVAFAYDDGTFEPDELVTVAAVREFLGNFETVFGRQAAAASALKRLTGADDEAVLNCDEVLAEFFGE